jgi:putative transposase
MQKYKPKKFSQRKIKEYSGIQKDETAVKVGHELIWLWVVIEPKDKEILSSHASKERNMFVSERFLSEVIQKYGMHSVSSDGGTWYPPQTCKILKLVHHIYTSHEKSLI